MSDPLDAYARGVIEFRCHRCWSVSSPPYTELEGKYLCPVCDWILGTVPGMDALIEGLVAGGRRWAPSKPTEGDEDAVFGPEHMFTIRDETEPPQ